MPPLPAYLGENFVTNDPEDWFNRCVARYYGVRSIPRPWSLVRDELDGHFGFPIVEKIEQANGYFRERLHELLEAA